MIDYNETRRLEIENEKLKIERERLDLEKAKLLLEVGKELREDGYINQLRYREICLERVFYYLRNTISLK